MRAMRPSSDKIRKLTVVIITVAQFCYSLDSASDPQLSCHSCGQNFGFKTLRGTPYVLEDGTLYRDLFTVKTSKAAGKFAQDFKQNDDVSLLVLIY